MAPLPGGRGRRPRGPLEPTPALSDEDTGRRWSAASSSCADAISWAGPPGAEGRGARLDLAPDLATPRGRAGSRPRAQGGRVVRRIETTHPGELVHIDVKKQAKIPKGGGWRVNGKDKRPNERQGTAGPGSATPTSTRPSTPTAAWPTARCTTTNAVTSHRLLAPGQGLLRELRHHRRAGDHRQRRVLPGQRLRRRALERCASTTPSPGPTGPRRTARSNDSTGRSSTNGPTPAPIAQRRHEPGPLTPGSTCTTITGTTPPSADHPSAASTTWWGRTSRPASDGHSGRNDTRRSTCTRHRCVRDLRATWHLLRPTHPRWLRGLVVAVANG